VLQEETAALLESAVFKEVVGGILFAAGDAMGAVAGHAWLRNRNLPLIALSGVLTSSPLQRRESSKATGLPVFSRQELAQTKTARSIMTLAERQRPEPAHRDELAPSSRDALGHGISEAAAAGRSEKTSVVEATP
jgi:hypothetical protein